MIDDKKLLALAVLACVYMWGCSDKVEFTWSDGRRTPLIAGFIDDSLVVAYDCREWLETTETWSIGDGYSEKSSCGHDRLLVFNYRAQEDGPRWSDSLTNKSGGYRWYQLTDSIFWRWDENDIRLWKLRDKAHVIDLKYTNDDCLGKINIEKIRPWKDGKFIAFGAVHVAGNYLENALLASDYGEDYCQYAEIDTMTGSITYKRLDKNIEWIKKCDDVRAWDNEVYCLILKDVPINLYLVKNGDPLDTLLQNNPYNWASYTKVGFSGNLLNLGNNVCKILDDKIFCLGISIRSALEYRIGNDFTVIYEELLF